MKKKKDVRFGSRFFMALIGIFLYAPIVLLIVFSFNAGNSNTVWKLSLIHIWGRMTLRNTVTELAPRSLAASNSERSIFPMTE